MWVVDHIRRGRRGGTFAPYVAQLTTVRRHLIEGDDEAVYEAMNRFMAMREAREFGVSGLDRFQKGAVERR